MKIVCVAAGNWLMQKGHHVTHSCVKGVEHWCVTIICIINFCFAMAAATYKHERKKNTPLNIIRTQGNNLIKS